MKKARFKLTIAMMILAVLAAGCTAKEQAGTNETSPAPTPAPSSANNSGGKAAPGKEEVSYKASDTPLELTIHLHYNNSRVFNDDWPVFKYAAELTNVTLKGTVPETATNSKEVFYMMLASNDLPDIIHGNRADMNQAGLEGALIPLEDLIEEHAPHLKKFLDENDWVRKGALAADGNLYVIPFVADGEASSGFFIRKDWLDRLGLEVPKTVDEYYQVLTAFRDQDPNQNGKKDEIPYFNRDKKGALKLAQLFGARTDWYVKDEAVHYGKYEPEYGEAIKHIAKWYSEGLIDQEIYTRGGKARDELLGDDVGGSTHDWFASTASYNDIVRSQVPDIEFVPMLPPADIHGVVKEENSRPLLGAVGWGISSANEHPVETIKYFDFWFTEEGRRLNNFGLEGVHYTMEDGVPIFKKEVLENEKTVLAQLQEAGAQLEIGFQQDFAYEEQWMNPIAKEGVRMYLENDILLPQFPALTFTDEEQKVITQKWTAIQTYIDEMEQKWIMGAEKVEDTFETYMKTLENMGMQDILNIYNNAYQRYLNR